MVTSRLRGNISLQSVRWPEFLVFDFTTAPPTTKIATWSTFNDSEVSEKLKVVRTRMDDDARSPQPSAQFLEALFPLSTGTRVRLSVQLRNIGGVLRLNHCMLDYEQAEDTGDHQFAVEMMSNLSAHRNELRLFPGPCK
jgi:hypothetical protein